MDSTLLWLGLLACAGAAAGTLAPFGVQARLALAAAALALAPVLVAADNWNGPRLVELREEPALLVAALTLAALAVAAVAAVVVRRPRWLPVILILVLPLRVPVELAGSTANLLLPLYAVIAGGLIAAALRPALVIPRATPTAGLASAVGPLLGAIVVLYAIQAGYADDLSVAVENVCFFFAPFAALALLLSRAPWDAALVRAALVAAAAAALVVAAVGFGQFAAGELFWNEKVIDGNEAHPYFRVNSLFFDPNIMGRYLGVTMTLLAAVAAWAGAVDARRAAAVFVVLLLALVLTFSQTSQLALLAGILVLLAALWGLPRGLLAAGATTAALLAVVLGLGGGGLTAETTGRTGLVSGGLELAEQRPLVGLGSGSFAAEFESRFGAGDGIAVESHTEPVTIAAEQGVIGLVPYVALLVTVVAALIGASGLGRARARDPLAAAVLAAMAAMAVHSLGYGAFYADPITWALLALALALPASFHDRAPARAEPQPAG